MIIEHAERYGLSELYQLRGRVGRSNRRAYCYLLIEPDTELTEVARKRLAALKEFSDLGAGFRLGDRERAQRQPRRSRAGFSQPPVRPRRSDQRLRGRAESPVDLHLHPGRR